DDRGFAGPSTARVHPVGSGFAVLRHWDEHRRRYQGWYVNLERPWRRTPIGFDSRDDVLDLTVADDLSHWRWKDEEELAWAVEVGTMSRLDAEQARTAGEAAIEAIERRAGPFDDEAWTRWVPPPLSVPKLPDEWDNPFRATDRRGNGRALEIGEVIIAHIVSHEAPICAPRAAVNPSDL